jgi:HTH-type transcriptional regulator / antitoxin HipB
MSPFDDIKCLETPRLLIRDATDIGSAIRDQRQNPGLDQQALAKRAKVSRQWIVEVEKSRPRAEIGLILRTIGALGLTVSVGTEAATCPPDPNPPAGIDRILDDLAS